jgi:predicted DsbA family dithiol-disulfide isomerase
VTASVQRAEELTEQYAVGGVPLLIVNGKYATSVSEAGSESRLLSLINDLAASEQQR